MEEIHKEMRVRKRLSTLFNKAREEFGSKEDYDSYLEMIEDHVYSLVNDDKEQVRQTEEKLKEYERTNRNSILANQARQAEAKRQPSKPEVGQLTAAGAGAAPAPVPTYMPQQTAPAGGMQTRPIEPARMDAEGVLLPGKPPSSRAEACRANAAGGWDPEIARRRMLQDALSSVFSC